MINKALLFITILVAASCSDKPILGKLLLTELRSRTNDVIDDGLMLLEELL